jgi:hypothetical protein
MMTSEHDHDHDQQNRDRDLEMSGVGHVPALEHSATNGGEDVKTSTFDEVEHSHNAHDPEKHGNVKIVKTDDSDGRVEWTARQIVATVSLSMLYVGA